jgi:uncharacterized protein (DUF4415 family)
VKTSKKAKTYSAKDLKDVSNNPEWTEEDFKKAMRFSEAFPDLARTIRRRGPGKKPRKQIVSLRLSPDVLDHFKAKGRGWQTKIDETLRKAAKLQRRAS